MCEGVNEKLLTICQQNIRKLLSEFKVEGSSKI